VRNCNRSTGLLVIAELGNLDVKYKLYINQSLEQQTSVTVTVGIDGKYRVSVFAVEEGGIVNSSAFHSTEITVNDECATTTVTTPTTIATSAVTTSTTTTAATGIRAWRTILLGAHFREDSIIASIFNQESRPCMNGLAGGNPIACCRECYRL
jgi:hypothetical protein